MKTKTRVLVVAVAGIAILAAAAVAIGAQKPKLDPPVFTIISNGKAVAVVTLLEGGSDLQMTAGGPSTYSGPSKDEITEGKITGKLTLQRKGDAQPLVVVNADEIQMVRKPSK